MSQRSFQRDSRFLELYFASIEAFFVQVTVTVSNRSNVIQFYNRIRLTVRYFDNKFPSKGQVGSGFE